MVLVFVISQIKHEVAVNCKTSRSHAFLVKYRKETWAESCYFADYKSLNLACSKFRCTHWLDCPFSLLENIDHWQSIHYVLIQQYKNCIVLREKFSKIIPLKMIPLMNFSTCASVQMTKLNKDCHSCVLKNLIPVHKLKLNFHLWEHLQFYQSFNKVMYQRRQ